MRSHAVHGCSLLKTQLDPELQAYISYDNVITLMHCILKLDGIGKKKERGLEIRNLNDTYLTIPL